MIKFLDLAGNNIGKGSCSLIAAQLLNANSKYIF